MSDPSVVDTVSDQFSNLPASQNASGSSHHLFGRKQTVHQLLGGREVSDVLLWRKRHISVGIFAVATAIWVIFEWLDYHVLSLAIWGILILLGVLFVWSNVASFLNRPPPPVKNVHLSEETAFRVAQDLRRSFNHLIMVLNEIALGKDIKLFLMIESGLWFLSKVGGWCDFLTLIYISIVLALTVPKLYELYEDKIDHSVEKGIDASQQLYGRTYDMVMDRVNQARGIDKKAQ